MAAALGPGGTGSRQPAVEGAAGSEEHGGGDGESARHVAPPIESAEADAGGSIVCRSRPPRQATAGCRNTQRIRPRLRPEEAAQAGRAAASLRLPPDESDDASNTPGLDALTRHRDARRVDQRRRLDALRLRARAQRRLDRRRRERLDGRQRRRPTPAR
ncbi:MAG: hypothetical protein MZV70_19485 [Desulfobacterales bacterium]|nr:hypothetical protein [Desulfobacterales bacterium]